MQECDKLKEQGFTYKIIRLTERKLTIDCLQNILQQYEDKPTDNIPRIFHFDVPPVVCTFL